MSTSCDLSCPDLAYQCYGAVGAPVLLMLHGFLGRAGDWQPLMARLQDDFYLIAIDLPGHGSSPWTVADARGADYFCHRLERTVQTIEQLPDMNPAPFTLLGYSLGGRLAMAYALAYPRRIERLILEGAHPGLTSGQEKADRYRSDLKWARRWQQEPVAQVLGDWYKQPVFADLDEDQVRSLIHERSNGCGMSLAEAMMSFSLAKQPDYRRALVGLRADSQFSFPVHYVYGANDFTFGQLGQRLLAERVIDSVHPVPGCGHNVHRQQPEAMARLLREPL